MRPRKQKPSRIRLGNATAVSWSDQYMRRIPQRAYRVAHEGKIALVTELLRQSGMRSVLIFVRRKVDGEQLARAIARSGIDTAHVHADCNAEERMAVIEAFQCGKYAALVVTEAAVWRLVVPRLSHVINFDVPLCAADYRSHIAQAARAGTPSAVITLVAPEEEVALERLLQNSRAALTPTTDGSSTFATQSERLRSVPEQPCTLLTAAQPAV